MRQKAWLTYTSGLPATRMSLTQTLTSIFSTALTMLYSQLVASAGTLYASQSICSLPAELATPVSSCTPLTAASECDVRREPGRQLAESELIAGYNLEYGSVKFAMFMAAEYVAMIVISAFAATLFLGGPNGPFLPGFVWLGIKIAVLLFIFIWVRATLPRFRYDRLMKFGWKVLIPVAMANVMVTAVVVGLGFAN